MYIINKGRYRMFTAPRTLLFLLLLSALPHTAWAEDYTITIKDQQFSPQSLAIPANQKVKITIHNTDATPAEFESSELNREKVVGANSDIILFVGPLDAGNYHYFNDFRRESSGIITAH